MLIDIDPADIVGTIEVTMSFDDGTDVVSSRPRTARSFRLQRPPPRHPPLRRPPPGSPAGRSTT